VKSKELDRSSVEQRRTDRFDLAFRATLLASLWLVLYLLGAQITQAVVIATIAAIFGPGALKAGLDRFSDRASGKP
jgi:uncharacterized membrane protein YjdF